MTPKTLNPKIGVNNVDHENGPNSLSNIIDNQNVDVWFYMLFIINLNLV